MHATACLYDLSSHPPAIVGRQEDDNSGDVVRLAEPPDLLSAGRQTHLERISRALRRIYGLRGASASKRRSVSSSQARMSFFAFR